jgi:hypothetical protein
MAAAYLDVQTRCKANNQEGILIVPVEDRVKVG